MIVPYPEAELLCACLSPEPNETTVARLDQLSPSDWEQILHQAIRQNVGPLLYHRFRTLSPNRDIPSIVMQKLRAMYLANAARNIRIYYQLTQILATLRNARIPVIVLKGTHLAEQVYGNIALRPMGDIDLLIREEDVLKAVEILKTINYTPSRQFQFDVERASHCHLPPLSQSGGIGIEIHWNLMRPIYPITMNMSELWQHAQPALIAGIETLVLSSEDLLLYLCIHTSVQHRFTMGLQPFCDIVEVLRRYRETINWEQVQRHVMAWGTSKCVYLTLYLARELLGIAVPEEILNTLKPQDLEPKWITLAQGQIFIKPEITALPMSSPLARVWQGNRLRDQIRTLLQSIFPPAHILATKYPVSPRSAQIYLYYLIHLKDMFLKYGPTVWRLWRHDQKMLALTEHEECGNVLYEWLTAT
jgi:hypothetical protein